MTITTTSALSSTNITNLPTMTFIAGTFKRLDFYVYDPQGSPIDISGFSGFSWKMCPYGRPEIVTLEKSGTYDATSTDKNRFIVYLYSTDTSTLSGKYLQQPVITTSTGYEFRVGQGYMIILPAIGSS
jgi:hypothetical protein